ncbi:ribonuclease mrp subunit rmp1 [Fusarium tjaetaba]|uniref:Ribonuclease mrp subunit rmp1 n=1 Tax=Fusarium tjaetaba TaxID=1567544 RepID=A0A8H5QT69_9HYPO|nr:ribonuclease mrp subunit rmp1 [Fusarium tjaetaba]KAF5619401.1 ribonuclease mrp subunit rmp1 [Fusarium tjaetaba]
MTTPPDPALLATTNDSLAPLIPILNGFAHRHKNQHSSTHWWSSFSILRRAVRNLVNDLNSRPRKVKSGGVKRDVHPALARAKWMMRHVVPGAFVWVANRMLVSTHSTFSQLAADNQHAPLGLLLLSVLARTNTILSQLVPDHDHDPPISSSAKPMPSEPSKHETSDLRADDAPNAGVDMGVAISREELMSTQKKTKPVPDSRSKDLKLKEYETKTTHIDTKRIPSKSDTIDKPRKKTKSSDELSSLFGSLSSKNGAANKPKKKKKKGDAFSSLFDSL